MRDVISIQQCDQHIHVEQRAHSVRVVFSQLVDQLVGDDGNITFIVTGDGENAVIVPSGAGVTGLAYLPAFAGTAHA